MAVFALEYLIAFGFVLFYIDQLIPFPVSNELWSVPSLIALLLLGGVKVVGIYLSIFLIVAGFIATAWKVGVDIYKNKAPVIVYFMIEIFIFYVYFWPYIMRHIARTE